MSQTVVARLHERFPDAILASHAYRGDETVVVRRERLLEVCGFLRDDPDIRMEVLVDLTAVDYLGREPRFEMVYHLHSLAHGHRLRIKCPLGEDDPTIDSLMPLWPAANWYERECWDLLGIRFRGHPDLRRIFMYPEFEGWPLRKDYPKEKRQPLIRREDLDGAEDGAHVDPQEGGVP